MLHGRRIRRTRSLACLTAAVLFLLAGILAAQADQAPSAAAQKLLEAGQAVMGQRSAIALFEEALALFRRAGDPVGEANTLALLGSAHNVLFERGDALECWEEARELWRSLGRRREEAGTLQTIGAISGNLQRKLEAFNQALVIWRELGDRERESTTLYFLHRAYHRLGQYQNALDVLEQSRSLAQQTNSGPDSILLRAIGGEYEALGERQKADDYYHQSAEAAHRRGQADLEGLALSAAAKVSTELREYRKALEDLNRALAIWQSLPQPTEFSAAGVALTLCQMASAYFGLDERDKALAALDRALAVVPQDRFEELVVRTAGLAYVEGGEKQRALDLLTRALALSRAISFRLEQADLLSRIARLERDLGRLEDARQHLEEALRLQESFRDSAAGPEARTSFGATYQKDYSFYIDLLMRLDGKEPGKGFSALALQTSERARGRSLLEILGEPREEIRRGADQELLKKEHSLELRLNAESARQEQLKRQKSPGSEADEVAGRIRQIAAELEKVKAQIRAANPGYAALTRPSPLSLKAIQEQVLDSDTLLLEYALGEERSYLWVVSKESVTNFELPKAAEIEAAAREVYALLAARNRPTKSETESGRRTRLNREEHELSEATARLSRMMLRPARAYLGLHRLLIVSEGVLQYIPLAILPDPANTSQLLLAAHEIVSIPSASVLAELRRSVLGRQPASQTVAVLADRVFDPGDPRVSGRRSAQTTPVAQDVQRSASASGVTDGQSRIPRLPFSRREAQSISAVTPHGTALQALDFRASRAMAMSPELARYRIVHFATHGLLNSETPALSGMVLSLVDERGTPQDGFLRLHEIYNLDLPAELVVLSACQTALGKEVKGEGLIGLTRGFMYAGAARVVASLWKVDDVATAELMSRFYRGMLTEGLRPAAALRTAQLEMWKQKRWQNPYFWAAFQLQGEWR